MKTKSSVFMLISTVFFISCQISKTNDNYDLNTAYQIADQEAEAISPDFIKQNNLFASRMFKAVASAETGKNLMISPLSISTALSMVMNGASGDNLVQMKNVLGYSEIDPATVNQQYSHLIASLESADKDISLYSADSIWMKDSFAPRVYESFTKTLSDNYEAEAYTLDFSDPKSVDTINSWVRKNSMKKIDTILDEINSETVMYLINAIYFKGAWTTTFDSASTYDGAFTLTGGQEKQVKLMTFKENQELKFFTSEEGAVNGYTAVRLPYGRGKLAFYGFIPASGTVDEFIKNLPDPGFENLFSNLVTTEIPVILPRFKFGYEKSLNDTLKSLGMNRAFENGGLLNLASEGEGLFISDVKHKTFIEVNEQGTEAAAVTSVEIGETCIPTGFFAVKPFFFLIRDDRTGAVLFMGKVEDPSL